MRQTIMRAFSFGYKTYRARVVSKKYELQDAEGKPRDLEDVVLAGDRAIKQLPQFLTRFSIPEEIGVSVYDLHFPSPLTLSAFKDDYGVISRWIDLGLGGATVKTIMPQPRDGNQRPRIQSVQYEGQEHFINAMGLPGPGLEPTIDELKKSGIFGKGRRIGLSIGGTTIEEYKQVFDRLEALRQTSADYVVGLPFLGVHAPDVYYELNISCPNTSDGQQITRHPELLDELLQYMCQRTTAVISVKVSPDASDETLLRLGNITRKYKRTMINAGNTTTRTCEQVGLPSNAISIGRGGLSGPSLYKRTKEMLKLLSPLGLPMISTGGIYCADQVRELQAIAKPRNVPLLIGMASAVVQDMYCIPRMNYDLARNPLKG